MERIIQGSSEGLCWFARCPWGSGTPGVSANAGESSPVRLPSFLADELYPSRSQLYARKDFSAGARSQPRSRRYEHLQLFPIVSGSESSNAETCNERSNVYQNRADEGTYHRSDHAPPVEHSRATGVCRSRYYILEDNTSVLLAGAFVLVYNVKHQ